MRFLIILIGVFISVGSLFGQTASELRAKRENTLKEIEYANKLLNETEGKTKESLNEINLINHRLIKRKELLIGLEVETNLLGESIEKNSAEISATEYDVSRIKRAYAAMIVNLYKKRFNRYKSMYFIASENLNQLYKRIYFVKIYNNYLKSERVRLENFIRELKARNEELAQLKLQKGKMADRTRSETIAYQREVNEKNKIVRQLKQRQQEIQEEIKNKERAARKIEAELKRIIEEERRKAKAKGISSANMAEEKILSGDFEKNSGKLPWPTQRGIITGKYGEHAHPDYKDVKIRNDGVYISTESGEDARAVFKGIVSSVFKIPGENYTVIIKHGQYLSVYHNLINMRVKAGQSVNTKEILGTVGTDAKTKQTVLYFQIWKETEKRDPELWLAPL